MADPTFRRQLSAVLAPHREALQALAATDTTATYRLIQFSPDPFSGMRFVLGAIVVDAQGGVSAVPVASLPSADCLGDRRSAIAALRLHARVAQITSKDTLPSVFGPYVTLTESRPVPSRASDTLGWVRNLLAGQTAEEMP